MFTAPVLFAANAILTKTKKIILNIIVCLQNIYYIYLYFGLKSMRFRLDIQFFRIKLFPQFVNIVNKRKMVDNVS